jgi:hypothetical protein
MMTVDKELEWLHCLTGEYHPGQNDTGGLVEELENEGMLGQGFLSMDRLDEVDIRDGMVHRPTYVSANLSELQKEQVHCVIKEFVDCFAWEYTEMLVLSRDLVEHKLPIKPEFRPFKQAPRSFNPLLHSRIKEEIDRLLKAKFIQPCRYAEWVSNIVPVEKNTDKIWVCVDFRNLNRATPKDEYTMPIAENLINRASGNKIISFLDGNAGYNQIFMPKEDVAKTVFQCPGFISLFEWVIMTFGLKNVGAIYQRAMNLIFHDLLGMILEVYIDDLVVKSAEFVEHLANLRLVFEKMRKYKLKMNPLKCSFGVSAS